MLVNSVVPKGMMKHHPAQNPILFEQVGVLHLNLLYCHFSAGCCHEDHYLPCLRWARADCQIPHCQPALQKTWKRKKLYPGASTPVCVPMAAQYVKLKTSCGSIVVELYTGHAPRTCQNFAELGILKFAIKMAPWYIHSSFESKNSMFWSYTFRRAARRNKYNGTVFHRIIKGKFLKIHCLRFIECLDLQASWFKEETRQAQEWEDNLYGGKQVWHLAYQ